MPRGVCHTLTGVGLTGLQASTGGIQAPIRKHLVGSRTSCGHSVGPKTAHSRPEGLLPNRQTQILTLKP